MIILGIDTATQACSVALLDRGTILAELTLNVKKTHSEKLMPLINSVLQDTGVKREQIGAVAVAAGPGSFTGLRIGIATARGLCQGLSIPGVAVPTLEAMACAFPIPGQLVCPVLDARRDQVYTALYSFSALVDQKQQLSCERAAQLPLLSCELEPAACSIDSLLDMVAQEDRQVIFTGEGLNSYAPRIVSGPGCSRKIIASAVQRCCRASLVALRGLDLLAGVSRPAYNTLLPVYLRIPEAERLAREREREEKGV